MSATAEVLDASHVTAEPARMVSGMRMVVRGSQRLFGVALTLAAVGLWLAPGSSWETDIMLFKLILSLTAVLAGLGLISASSAPPLPEVEIDPIRREVRLVRRQRGRAPITLQRCSFAKLAKVEHQGNCVRLWDQRGYFIAETNLSDRQALSSLLAGLRDAGKLA